MPKKFNKFEGRETLIFVKLYLSHECLWNKYHEFYKSKFHRLDAQKDIIEKFAEKTNISLDLGAVRRKITILRSTYLQELRSMTTRSTPESPYVPSIKWFSPFHRCFRGMKMKDENGEQMGEEDNSAGNSTEVWLEEEEDDKDTEEPFSPEDYMHVLKTEPELQMDNDYKQQNRKRKIKKQRESSDDSDFIQRRNKKYRCRSDSEENVSKAKEDEFDIYGKYIATQLREMGLQKALGVQLKIQSIVSEARMENLPATEPC